MSLRGKIRTVFSFTAHTQFSKQSSLELELTQEMIFGRNPTVHQNLTHSFWKLCLILKDLGHFKGIELDILVLIYVKSFSNNF